MTHRFTPDVTEVARLAEWLHVLAEPNRLHILHLLMEGVQCNCELGSALDAPANLVSHHLRVLREAGLVDMARDPLDGRWVYYSVNPDALRALQTGFVAFFDPARMKPRRVCGPAGVLELAEIALKA
jgi:ArsR family transcriptional regulator